VRKPLPDHLARYATGAEFTLRELYTTNQVAKFAANASLVLTAILVAEHNAVNQRFEYVRLAHS
jgi:hypothetical protein